MATTTRLRPPTHRVSRKAVRLWTLQAAIGSAVTAALLSAAVWALRLAWWDWVPEWALRNAWWLVVLYGVYALARVVIVPQWRYRVHRWEITADVVYTRSGWFSRQWQLVPVSRIQTVDHRQGWMERMFGVATLEVQTASHAGSSTIEGLAAADAQRISEELAQRAAELRDDAT
ncbi:PH domain-containing protein [Streptomonospora salina]|uniref:PH domain-containing protein n=1 Tax=Streptomonospora salina TaxID=104205 RepID=UPI0036DBB7E4